MPIERESVLAESRREGTGVAKSAYCSGCGRRVDLDAAGECPQGHLRSMLRDVREGVAAPAPVAPATAGQVSRPGGPPNQRGDLAGQVLGKAIIIVPALIIGVIAVGITEPQYEFAGMTPALSWVASFFTVAITLGVAAAWGVMRGRNRSR